MFLMWECGRICCKPCERRMAFVYSQLQIRHLENFQFVCISITLRSFYTFFSEYYNFYSKETSFVVVVA